MNNPPQVTIYPDPDRKLDLIEPRSPLVQENFDPDNPPPRVADCPLAECARAGHCTNWYRCESSP